MMVKLMKQRVKFQMLVAQLKNQIMIQKLLSLKRNLLIMIMITTPEFNNMAANVFNARLAEANLITDFDAKLSSLNNKITTNKSKNLLVENELKKLKTFESSYFIGKSHFEEDGTQNYLVFQPMYRYFKRVSGKSDPILWWKSKRLSDEKITLPTASNNSLSPALSHYDTKTRVKFTESCLKQDKITSTQSTIVNIYIVYELSVSSSLTTDPTLQNSLFGAVRLTKNADIDKYHYSGQGIEFDRRSSFSFQDGGFGQNVIIFGADMSLSAHVDNKKKTS